MEGNASSDTADISAVSARKGVGPILEGTSLGRQIEEGHWLFRNISIVLRPGERVGLVGPTGAGKTVLLRALSMLDACQEGTVLWHGRAVSSHDVPRFRSRAVYIQQRPSLGGATVRDALQHPYTLQIHKGKTLNERTITDILNGLGRDDSLLDRSTSDLSGGELQMAALIRALQLDPDVLLLDEPTAAMDMTTAHLFEEWMVNWTNKRPGRAYIWVSHAPRQIERVATRELLLRDGKLLESG